MNVEERISNALRQEADAVDVDVTRLHAATLRAIRPAPRSRRSRVLVLVGASVAVLTVVLVAVLVGGTTLFEASRPPTPAQTDRTSVATAFTCPRQLTVDDAGRRRDDSFLPSLTPGRGPAGEASANQAPRYAYVESRGTATLRLGNADGSLASVSRFRRVEADWDLVTTTKCVGADGGVQVPDEGVGRLGEHGTTPYPPDDLVENAGEAILIDDRSSYDVAGLVRHRSMWASPCRSGGTAICMASGTPTNFSSLTVRAGEQPQDITDLLLNPDDSEGMPQPWRLWVVADPGRGVLGVRANTRTGGEIEAVRRRGPSWTGQLYVLLARGADVDSLTVRTTDGSRSYPKGDID